MKSLTSGIVLFVSGLGAALFGPPLTTIMLMDGSVGLSAYIAIVLGLVVFGTVLSCIGSQIIWDDRSNT